MTEYVETLLDDPVGLVLTGDWTLPNAEAIAKRLKTLQVEHKTKLRAQLGHMDTAGAMILNDFLHTIGGDTGQVDNLNSQHKILLEMVAKSEQKPQQAQAKTGIITRNLAQLGKRTILAWENFLDLLRFVGQATAELGGVIRHPRRLRSASIARHIKETGWDAIPIVSLIAFLISIVMAYQGATQLERFGAQIFTINMIAISVLREMGVLLTAIIIAGRSGSAFTAEIGVMKVNEEVDAMQVIGARPFEVLVLPRLIALAITLPLLTFIADMMGLFGGGVTSVLSLHVNPEQYIHRARIAVKMWDFWVGMIKAPVFAFFIAIVGCMRGMQVSGSAESVGRLTTVSVVQSIFLVLLLDALFSILFTKLGV